MAAHSSILAWRIPWTEEPVKLQSMGSQRAGHNWVTNTHTHINVDLVAIYGKTKKGLAQTVQSLSHVWLLVISWTAAHQAFLSITNSQSLLRLLSIGMSLQWVGNAIQPSHPLSSSSPAFNLSQHQGLFQWVNSSHEVAKVLEFQLQHQSFKEHPGLISFRMDWLDLLAIQGLSGVFSNTTVQKHQFFGAQLSSQSNSHIHTWLLEKP